MVPGHYPTTYQYPGLLWQFDENPKDKIKVFQEWKNRVEKK